MDVRDRVYIGGEWVVPSSPDLIDVVDSTTEKVIARVPNAGAADIDRAVAAARAAFATWRDVSPEERAAYLVRIAEGLKARTDDLAEAIAREVGSSLAFARGTQVGSAIRVFETQAAVLSDFAFEEEVGPALVVKEPIGVVGAITPWNYPLLLIASKLASCLAAGCTMVLKPSQVAPLNAFILTEVIHDAGLPAGVFNMVTGAGRVIGEALAGHPDVDMITLTGSTTAGTRVSEVAAGTVKRVVLELGGKSANVILDDADLEKVVPAGVASAFSNSGQTCTALTRMLVPRALLADVEKLAIAAAEKFTTGDPFAEGTQLGPLVSAAQLEIVRDYIRRGLDEGAKLLVGGLEPIEGLDSGYFVRPTIFSEVRTEMAIAQDEIFGPVLSIIPYESDEEAVEIANDSVYGLAGAVWSADQQRAERVARRIRTGSISVNGGANNLTLPFGGFKQSGNGRERGKYGIDEFLEVKALLR
jgi:aldehyde dehydrogenase (NAD+)